MRGCFPGAVAALLVSVGCGGSSPAAPSGANGVPFEAGRYNLLIIGLQCVTGAVETALPSVRVTVAVQPNGTAWVAAPEQANGTLALRFERGPALPNVPTAIVLSGTLSGNAEDEAAAGAPPPDPTRVALGVAPVSGTMVSPQFAAGRVDAQIVFTRGDSTTTCIPGRATWTLSRAGLS